MSAFDPDTGFRVVPDAVTVPGAVAAARRGPRNPYDLALGVVWISAAALGLLLLLIAPLQQTGAGAVGSLLASGVLGVIALLFGGIHLGVRAIGWRPSEG